MSKPLYPYRAKLLPLVQEAGLKRSGLVSECILPSVKVDGCNFEWIDWATTADKNGKFDNLKKTDDLIGCVSRAKEIDPSSFEYKQGKLKDRALKMALKVCCVSACSPSAERLFSSDAIRMEELVDRLLLQREFRVIEAATDETKYTAQATTDTDKAEGAVYDLAALLDDPTFDALAFFRELQEENFETGARDTMVTKQWIVNKLISNDSFKDGGCSVPSLTSIERIAELIGVRKICIADTQYNAALPGEAYALQNIFPDAILMTVSPTLRRTDEMKRVFGFSAYDEGFGQDTWFDADMGKTGGFWGKVYHDYTEIIAEQKAATLIKVQKA